MILPEPNLSTGWDPNETLPEGWKSMSNHRVVSEGDVINDIDDIDGQGSTPSSRLLSRLALKLIIKIACVRLPNKTVLIY